MKEEIRFFERARDAIFEIVGIALFAVVLTPLVIVYYLHRVFSREPRE